MIELPTGWSESTFEFVLKSITNGISSKQNKEKNGIPVSRIETIADQSFNFEKIGYVSDCSKVNIKNYKLEKGDILFSHINSSIHLGKTAIFDDDRELYHGTNLLRLVVDSNVCSYKFFNFYCKLSRALGLFSLDAQHAVNQSSLNQKKIKSFRLPIPPLPEQNRIVEKLDSVLAQVDTIQQRLNNLPDIIKRFRQSVLAAAVSGKLTEQWRDENSISESSEELLERWLKERKERFNAEQLKLVSEEKIKRPRKFKEPSLPDLEKRNLELPHTWTLVSVSQFSDCLDYIRVPVKKDDRNSAKGLYPYFGANGIVDYVDDYLFDDELVLVTEDETFYGRTKPIAFRSSGKCWVNNHAHVLRPVTKIASEYLCYSLMHYDVQPWLSGSTGRAKLGQAALNELPIGLPPETEIIEVVRVIEQYFALADTLEKNLANAKQRVDNLTQSILAKAFRGELVPQDPNDEPADKLLARIKVARLEAEKLEKAAKKAAKASKK